MSPGRFATRLVLIVVAGGLVAGCGGDDDPPCCGPSGIVSSIAIQGPASIAPGQSAQYTVSETLSNGTIRVLSDASWTSSDSGVVQVTASGLATAQSHPGEIRLSVRTNTTNMTSFKDVLVLPPNTFRLAGLVTDMEATAILGARVEVIDGPSTTADFNGAYRLYGVPPEADVRVTASGYTAIEQHFQLTTHKSFDFRIHVDVEGRNLAGDYTLTLEATSSCINASRPLAAELRRRSYDATVTQDDARLQVMLTEPRFAPVTANSARLSGTVTPTGARFEIGSDDWFSDLTEQLPNGSRLEISGIASTTGLSGVLSGGFSGWFSHQGPNGEVLGSCDASRFTLARR